MELPVQRARVEAIGQQVRSFTKSLRDFVTDLREPYRIDELPFSKVSILTRSITAILPIYDYAVATWMERIPLIGALCSFYQETLAMSLIGAAGDVRMLY